MDSLLHKDLAQRDALVDHSVHGAIFHQGGLRDMCSRALGMKGLFFRYSHDGHSWRLILSR